jgi:transcriptional regulator with XRE-family HTH domain
MNWRDRLLRAIHESGCTQITIAERAELAPPTVSRVLNARHAKPAFDTIVRLAHAANVSVGWLLDEEDYRLTARERQQLRDAAELIRSALR